MLSCFSLSKQQTTFITPQQKLLKAVNKDKNLMRACQGGEAKEPIQDTASNTIASYALQQSIFGYRLVYIIIPLFVCM